MRLECIGDVMNRAIGRARAVNQRALDPLDAKQNVFAGVKYLSNLLDRYNGNVSMALAGYNAGPTAVKRFRGIPPYRETRGYVRKIQNLIAEGVKSASAATATVAD